jgi:hypothetical protein
MNAAKDLFTLHCLEDDCGIVRTTDEPIHPTEVEAIAWFLCTCAVGLFVFGTWAMLIVQWLER